MKIERFIHLASVVTILNMFAGFLSITVSLNNDLQTATWLIFWAAVFDAFDGKIARFTGTTSKFGLELDSLADLVSFGVAPSILILSIFSDLGLHGVFLVMISFFPLLFVSIRLARFNTLASAPKDYFYGLPAPVGALVIALFFLFMESYNWFLLAKSIQISMMLSVILMVAYLNISTFRFKKVAQISFKKDMKNTFSLIFLISAVFLLFFFRGKIGFPLVILYVLKNIFYSKFVADSDTETFKLFNNLKG